MDAYHRRQVLCSLGGRERIKEMEKDFTKNEKTKELAEEINKLTKKFGDTIAIDCEGDLDGVNIYEFLDTFAWVVIGTYIGAAFGTKQEQGEN